MRKKRGIRIAVILSSVFILFTIICAAGRYLFSLYLSDKAGTEVGSGSVGIIGGADGPTTIIVSAAPSGLFITLILSALLIAGAACFVIVRGRKKKKDDKDEYNRIK